MSKSCIYKIVLCCASALAFSFAVKSAAKEGNEGTRFTETIAVLTEIYQDEVQAYSSYRVYAEKAEEEGYSRIATLFQAIAVSEMIHARNMKNLLEHLGEEVAEMEVSVEAASTKQNLKTAMEVEFSEISESYPSYLERITPEGYQPAIDAVRYSWNSEKQHRDNINRIRRFVGLFFGAVADKIESGPEAYHVCTVCGSTVDDPPEPACSICGALPSRSVRVPGEQVPEHP